MEYDVFICHASEDKGFVEPLAKDLNGKGLKVWYDRFELKIGDSLRQKIDYGLANSRYGIVVLSEVFFTKGWPQSELDALEGRQNAEGRKVILPIWHKIEAAKVQSKSPLLASLLAAKSCDGLEIVVSQIMEVCSEKDEKSKRSVFQTSGKLGLRERCLDVIKNGSMSEWTILVDELQGPIESKLLKWKKRGEMAFNQGNDEWPKAIDEAIDICMPGFMPLFAAVYAGRKEHWKNAVGILRHLAMLEGKMGGGCTEVLRIGWNILYVPGNVGMAIAVETGQKDFLFDWMYLEMPDYGYVGVRWWATIGYAFNRSLEFLLNLYELEYIRGFLPSKERMYEYLFKANLLQSIIELRLWSENSDRVAIIESRDSRHMSDIIVEPWWCTIKPEDFGKWGWDLFNSSDGFINFFMTNRREKVSPEKIWSWWKGWKKICEDYMYTVTRGGIWSHTQWLTLPGEPQG